MKLAILMACHNRVATTYECLTSIFSQIDFSHSFQVFLVDDGSSDGTSEMVSRDFPQVKMFRGNGSLYWNGAMRLAWLEALKSNFDYYLWLNDDVTLVADALSRIIQIANDSHKVNFGALVGTVHDPVKSIPTYGGRDKKHFFNPLSCGPLINVTSYLQFCRFINGNFCLIPSISVEKIGILDPKFTHNMGDHDYGLRLLEAGFKLCVAPGIYGFCKENPKKIEIFDSKVPIQKRLALLNKPNSIPHWREQLIFDWRHGGFFKLVLCSRTLFRAAFPMLWLKIKEK
jgi:GT2 family glycosyltransferase